VHAADVPQTQAPEVPQVFPFVQLVELQLDDGVDGVDGVAGMAGVAGAVGAADEPRLCQTKITINKTNTTIPTIMYVSILYIVIFLK